MRPIINHPQTPEEWNHLPQEFNEYLEYLDKVRLEKLSKEVIDPLYPTYDYEWELDSEIPFETILLYWNDVEKELPDPIKILTEINDCIAETSYDDYISSFYAY